MGGNLQDVEIELAVLREQVRSLLEQQRQRATREWAVIMAVGGLVLTVFGKAMGIFL